jgi:hypothetical protein
LSIENPHDDRDVVPTHDLKDGVWCAVSALMITGCRVFSQNSKLRTFREIERVAHLQSTDGRRRIVREVYAI